MQQAHKNENKRVKNKKQYLGDKILPFWNLWLVLLCPFIFHFTQTEKKTKAKNSPESLCCGYFI